MILRADARHIPLADESVQCCVTSPPYWGLRDYGTPGQLGLCKTPEEYVANMVAVFQEVRRVLKDDGVVFLNLGDSYFGSSTTGGTNSIQGTAKRKGAMFSKNEAVARAAACGTSDKEPEDSPSRGCLCGSLCDACRRAYQIGKSHNGSPPDSTPALSPSAPNPSHKGSRPAHPPTLDSSIQVGHNANATLDLASSATHEGELHLASLQTMTPGSSPQPQGDFRQSDTPSVCLLCGMTLKPDVPVSSRKSGCTCGIGLTADTSSRRKSGISSSDLAYPHSTITPLKSKDLVGIPWRVAFALQADGWYLRSDIIWSKPNPMPESVTDRPTKAHEYIFLMSKSAKYYYDAAAIAEPIQTDPAENYPARAHILGRGNQESSRAPVGSARRDNSGGYAPKGKALTSPRNDGNAWNENNGRGFIPTSFVRNKRTVWNIPTMPYPGSHFATFPEEIPRLCILAGSRPGDVILDPFGGSGTTSKVALELGRKPVHIDLTYHELARKRMTTTPAMAGLMA